MTGDFFHLLHERHERLKKRIHSFRIPLSPRGQAIMKVVYFSIPVIGGYFIMESAKSQSQKNLDNFDKLRTRPLSANPDVQHQNSALQKVLNSVQK